MTDIDAICKSSATHQQKVFPATLSRISGEHWRDLPEAKAPMLVAK
jgi:hypothetical protein